MAKQKVFKSLDMGKFAVAAKGHVYGPGIAKIPEHLYDQVQSRLETLKERRNPKTEQDDFSSEVEDADSDVGPNGNEEDGNFEGMRTVPVEDEIPTVEELVRKNRAYLESKAEQLNIPDPSSFQSKTKLAAAIVEALENPDEEELDEDEEELDEEDEEEEDE